MCIESVYCGSVSECSWIQSSGSNNSREVWSVCKTSGAASIVWHSCCLTENVLPVRVAALLVGINIYTVDNRHIVEVLNIGTLSVVECIHEVQLLSVTLLVFYILMYDLWYKSKNT